MDGFQVKNMAEAAKIGEIFVTVTGNKNVIRAEHFRAMKDGAIVANSGHFNVEIDIPSLEKMASKKRQLRPHLVEYTVGGKKINLLADGRLVNLAAGEGHPSEVMDMSFADQALTNEYLVKKAGGLAPGVYDVPKEIDDTVAELKLKAHGLGLEKLTREQIEYMGSWKEGT
jgi:adenosylhomocysteinase